MSRYAPLFNEEAAQLGANRVFEFDHTDLTHAVDAETMILVMLQVTALKQSVEVVRWELLEPFENTAEAGNDTTLFEVGDDGDTDRLLTQTQGNLNGTEVYQKAGTGTKHVFSAGNNVDLLVTPKSGTNLAELNKGKARIYLNVRDSRD